MRLVLTWVVKIMLYADMVCLSCYHLLFVNIFEVVISNIAKGLVTQLVGTS